MQGYAGWHGTNTDGKVVAEGLLLRVEASELQPLFIPV
jgi:hypothetical protein